MSSRFVPWRRVLAQIAMVVVAGWFMVACVPGESDEAGQPEAVERPVVVLETNMGTVAMQLDPEKAPETVANFLLHVRSKFYDSLTFYRVKSGFMIQAGLLTADGRERTSPAWPVANEGDNGLKNVRGAVAMARTGDAHSAKTDFFINHVDNPDLDFKDKTAAGWGYAVFGRVIEGMDVVDAIAAVPTTRRGRRADIPVDPVIISQAYLRQ